MSSMRSLSAAEAWIAHEVPIDDLGLDALAVEPVIAFGTGNKLQVGVVGSLAHAVFLPFLRIRVKYFLLAVEICPCVVHGIVGGADPSVDLDCQDVHFAFDAADVEVYFLLGGKYLAARDDISVVIEQVLG